MSIPIIQWRLQWISKVRHGTTVCTLMIEIYTPLLSRAGQIYSITLETTWKVRVYSFSWERNSPTLIQTGESIVIDNSHFVLETSSHSPGISFLTQRQSLAIHHPHPGAPSSLEGKTPLFGNLLPYRCRVGLHGRNIILDFDLWKYPTQVRPFFLRYYAETVQSFTDNHSLIYLCCFC